MGKPGHRATKGAYALSRPPASFSLSEAEFFKLAVFDILGRQVALLVNGPCDAGSHTLTFDVSTLASGVYRYRLEAGDFTAVRKMVLMK